MRLHIASDLHLNEGGDGRTGFGPLTACDADALILAGDIDRVDNVENRFKDWPYPVMYVRGNHDSYFTSYEAAISKAVAESGSARFHMLERRAIHFLGVRILGCCLWTDFELFGRLQDALLLAQHTGPDFKFIRRADGRYFDAAAARAEHLLSVRWIATTLKQPFDGRTVVVTHHAPHPRSLDPARGRRRLDSAFASDLSRLMPNVNLWVHGHVHHSSDYKVKRCRVVCNPAGNRKNPNPHFVPSLVVDI